MADPRVFISYSHDSEDHREAVLQLAQQLRGWGVDVHLDRFVTAPDAGWPRWMMAEVDAADFVVLVCTPTYRRRFEGQEAAGKGKGATFEGLLAIQHLYDANTRNNKFIPVAFAGGAETDIPLVLRPYTRYTLPGQFEPLYRHITGQPEVVAAALGPRKVLPRRGAAAPPATPATSPDASAATPTRAPLAAATVRSEGGRDVHIEPAELLHRLLLSLFSSADQFRQWVSLGPDGHKLVAEFPGGSTSASAAIFSGLDVLRRHGHLDADFYARLVADYPRRSDDIHRVATIAGAASHGATVSSSASTSTRGGIHIGNVGDKVHIQAGGDLVAGDKHVTTLAAPALDAVHHALDALRAALADLGGADPRKIDRALEEAAEELARPAPHRVDVRDSVDRALKVAARVAPDIATRPAVASPLATLHAWAGS